MYLQTKNYVITDSGLYFIESDKDSNSVDGAASNMQEVLENDTAGED